jgi:hypothetical protein
LISFYDFFEYGIFSLDVPVLKSRGGVLLLQVLVTDPSKLQAIRDREEDIMKERIELILKAVWLFTAVPELDKTVQRTLVFDFRNVAGCQCDSYYEGHRRYVFEILC